MLVIRFTQVDERRAQRSHPALTCNDASGQPELVRKNDPNRPLRDEQPRRRRDRPAEKPTFIRFLREPWDESPHLCVHLWTVVDGAPVDVHRQGLDGGREELRPRACTVVHRMSGSAHKRRPHVIRGLTCDERRHPHDAQPR